MPDNPAAEIDAKIASLDDWRGQTLAAARKAILAAGDGIEETVKWRKPGTPGGVPVWEKHGVLCTGEVYKDKVKLTFAQGAALDDPAGLFNASLAGGTRRAIDFFEGDAVDAKALGRLVEKAARFNEGKKG